MNNKSKSLIINIILIIIGFITFSCLTVKQPATTAHGILSGQDTLSRKTEIPAKIEGRQEQIIAHTGYIVSYNSDWKIPNWVAYELTKQEMEGTVPRSNDFIPDPDVSYENSSSTDDYKNSGWDRGHMAPAGDMKWSEQAMTESFYLSNICPQNHNLNEGVWNDLELQIRDLARQNDSIFIVCGPIVSKQPQTIGYDNVAVPDAFFKVLLMNKGGKWNAIAFLFPNKSGRKPLSTYAMSVEDMQIITDINFFPALPDSIEKNVESKVDFTKWNINSKK